MKTLKVGDIRQKGDETRRLYERTCVNPKAEWGERKWEDLPSAWEPVSLIGHSILPSDLFNAEFRRP